MITTMNELNAPDLHDYEIRNIIINFSRVELKLSSEDGIIVSLVFDGVKNIDFVIRSAQAVVFSVRYVLIDEVILGAIRNFFPEDVVQSDALGKYFYEINFSTNCKFKCISEMPTIDNSVDR